MREGEIGELEAVTAFAPAGIGNLAAGFDVLGAAIAPLDGRLWGDLVEVRPAKSDSLQCVGPFAHRLPANPKDNLVWRARSAFERQIGGPLPPLAFVLHKNLPVASGLGSSASSAAATTVALNEACGRPLGEESLLLVAGEAESSASGAMHLDNVAPALLGGLRLVDPANRARELPFPEELVFVLWVPELSLETRVARSVLPRDVSVPLAIAHAQNLGSLIHALHTHDLELLAKALRDPLAEPFRAALVPGFRAVQTAVLAAGALGCSLSGAGPAIFAVTRREAAVRIAGIGEAAWRANGVAVEARVCHLDKLGARRVNGGA
ncbi:MAG: homoserine kinase [Acidobacteriota bacterium]